MVEKRSKRHRKREKRFRPEKLISEKEFLNPELRRTKDDLPTHLEIIEPRKKKKTTEPKVNSLTRKHLGSGKRPKWMDCPEEEVNEDDEKREKKETESSN